MSHLRAKLTLALKSGGRQAALLDESQDLKKDQSENDAIFSGFRELKKTYQKIKADPEKQWTAGFGQELRDAEESQSFLFKVLPDLEQ